MANNGQISKIRTVSISPNMRKCLECKKSKKILVFVKKLKFYFFWLDGKTPPGHSTDKKFKKMPKNVEI